MASTAGYYESRFTYDHRRDIVWGEIVRDLARRQLVSPQGVVVELGAGYCHCINQVRARRRIAVDLNPDFAQYATTGVEAIVQASDAAIPVEDNSVDTVIASNLFEHLTREQLTQTAAEVRRILKPGGQLVAIQPNFYYCYREYFDDYTHVFVFTHNSLRDFFVAEGFSPSLIVPRYIPFSMRSRAPKARVLVSLYLRSPIRPFAKQMLLAWRKA
jgi:SAM-dependent methyltransferase